MAMRNSRIVLVLLAASVALSTLGISAVRTSCPQSLQLADIDVQSIRDHVEFLNFLGSRVTGYPGNEMAADYIFAKLREFGLSPVRHNFSVTVPLDHGSYVEILSPAEKRLEAFALWPNGPQASPTPRAGLVGKLITVGKGEIEDFDGKDVSGAIVLMDFNSMDNWLNAAKFGAVAAIYIEPESTTYPQAYSKFLSTPVLFPRLLVRTEDAEELRNATEVRIFSNIRYEEKVAWNIIAEIEGEASDEVLIYATHYDSWSVVPAISPSANEAVSVGVLLEIAGAMSKIRPARNIMFVFFSGHWQGLAGPREFTEDYIFSSESVQGKRKYLSFVSLEELSTDGYGLQFLFAGHFNFYGGSEIHGGGALLRTSYVRRQILNYVSEEPVSKLLGEKGYSDAAVYFRDASTRPMFWNTEPWPYMIDAEAPSSAGLSALTVSTSFSYRQYRGSPLDDLDTLDFGKVEVMANVLAYALTKLSLEKPWGQPYADVKPERLSLSATKGRPGYTKALGTVLLYNLSKGWYESFSDAIVFVSNTMSNYKLHTIIITPEEDGSFEVLGLPPAYKVHGVDFPIFQWAVTAWGFDPDTGQLIYAPDIGVQSSAAFQREQTFTSFPFLIVPFHDVEQISTVVMRASSVTVFDAIDASLLRTPMVVDPRISGYFQDGTNWAGWFGYGSGYALPLDVYTKGPYTFYGLIPIPYESVTMAWVPEQSKHVMILYTSGAASMIFSNSTSERPDGQGISADSVSRINETARQSALDFYVIGQARYDELTSRYSRSISVDRYYVAVEEILEELSGLPPGAYSEEYALSLRAWLYSRRAYQEVMGMINDGSKSVLLFFALAIPAILFLEKLVLHSEGLNRIFAIAGTGAVVLGTIAMIHPVIPIMSNSFMGLLGSLSLLALLLTVFVLLGEGERIRQALEVKFLGIHRSEMSTVDVMLSSFSVAVENMRKRKFRTMLTLVTIVTLAAALTSLTVTSTYTEVDTARPARYLSRPTLAGGLIRRGFGTPPDVLQEYAVDYVRAVAGDVAQVFPRAWLYGRAMPTLGSALEIWSGKTNRTARAALGITEEELKTILPSLILEEMQFDESRSIVLPSGLAKNLSVAVGDEVMMYGLRFNVVGIFEPGTLSNVVDCDGRPITPTNPLFVQPLSFSTTVAGQAGQQPIPAPDSEVVVIPYEVAKELGGFVSSIYISFNQGVSESQQLAALKEIAINTDLTTFWSRGPGDSNQLSRKVAYSLVGWDTVQVLILIGVLNVGLTVLGSVKERTREIGVISALGLSPLGTSMLFIVESTVYAVIGTLLGYIVGFGMNVLLMSVGIAPPVSSFNYGSVFVALAMAAVAGAALLASIYPSWIASRIITPSLERRWKPPTKPGRDEWEMPLPMALPSFQESCGFLEYLEEYLNGSGAVRPAHVIRNVSRWDPSNLSLTYTVALAPFEAGVEQTVVFAFSKEEERYQSGVSLTRTGGDRDVWVNSNYYFLDDLRKQILMWRALPPTEQERIINRALERQK